MFHIILQISHAELDFIVTKAEQWRGEEGERRKTAIYDYVWEEEVTRTIVAIVCSSSRSSMGYTRGSLLTAIHCSAGILLEELQ